MTSMQRFEGRAANALRPLHFELGLSKYAGGSVLIKMGDTHVLCNASVLNKVPGFLRDTEQGWVTAEYSMLPRSTHTRSDREAVRGKQSGRTQEIQRLIGRSLRAAFDLTALGQRTIHIDCDVIQADGGTLRQYYGCLASCRFSSGPFKTQRANSTRPNRVAKPSRRCIGRFKPRSGCFRLGLCRRLWLWC